MRVVRKTLVSAPAVEPLVLADVKNFINVSHTDDDALITSLIKAARQHVEQTYNVALINQTWDFTLDEFPQYKETSDPDALIEPLIKPVSSVTNITYYDAANVLQTLSASAYELVANNYGWPYIRRAYNNFWPETYDRTDAVKVRIVAGYGASGANVPEPVKIGMSMFVKFMYDNREDMPVRPYVRTMDLLLNNHFGHDL